MYPSGRSRERGFHGILRAMAHNRSVYFLSCVGNMTIFSKLSMRATRILMDALSINSFLLHLRSVVAAMVVEVAVLVTLVVRVCRGGHVFRRRLE